MVLDSPYAEFNRRKLCAGIPLFMVLCLVAYIAGVSAFSFLPEFYPLDGDNLFFACLWRILTAYFLFIINAFAIKAYAKNPGYVPKTFKMPKTEEGHAPVATLRVYTLRGYLANGFNHFDKYAGGGYATSLDIEMNDSALSTHSNDKIINQIKSNPQE